MGMCSSGYIFQDKLDELPGDIEGVKTYINDILLLRKEIFSKHIEKLKIIFGILHAASLKFNSPKCRFWVKGYSLSRLCNNTVRYKT